MERTLAMIKPDGVARGLIGEVIKRIEAEHINIVNIKMTQLTKVQAKEFYAVHKNSRHFEGLTTFTASGPVVAMVLEGLDIIPRWRSLIGATDSSKALPGTIRGDLGNKEVIRENVVHGSDSLDSSATEIKYFFGGD